MGLTEKQQNIRWYSKLSVITIHWVECLAETIRLVLLIQTLGDEAIVRHSGIFHECPWVSQNHSHERWNPKIAWADFRRLGKVEMQVPIICGGGILRSSLPSLFTMFLSVCEFSPINQCSLGVWMKLLPFKSYLSMPTRRDMLLPTMGIVDQWLGDFVLMSLYPSLEWVGWCSIGTLFLYMFTQKKTSLQSHWHEVSFFQALAGYHDGSSQANWIDLNWSLKIKGHLHDAMLELYDRPLNTN